MEIFSKTEYKTETDKYLQLIEVLNEWLMSNVRKDVRFEVFTAVTMKSGVIWDVTPCGSCKNRRFGGTQRLLHQGDKNR
jgi:hypothetical protein